MKIGTRGTTRNGQTGTIIAVFTNALLFRADTGAQFTILNDEFTPAGSSAAERRTIASRAQALFDKIGINDGFVFGTVRLHDGTPSYYIQRVPPFGGGIEGRTA